MKIFAAYGREPGFTLIVVARDQFSVEIEKDRMKLGSFTKVGNTIRPATLREIVDVLLERYPGDRVVIRRLPR